MIGYTNEDVLPRSSTRVDFIICYPILMYFPLLEKLFIPVIKMVDLLPGAQLISSHDSNNLYSIKRVF